MIPLITHSGNVNYAKIPSRRNRTFIFSDSIAKRINMNEFNNRFPAGDAFKQSFPGVTASKLRCYMKTVVNQRRTRKCNYSSGYKQYY